MILYPAIDIRGGHTVRLAQGDYDRETAYDSDPVEAALRWEAGGADWLHIVDLDGARSGTPANLGQVSRIGAAVGCQIQLGGGLRDSKRVEEAFSAGVERVVLGTTALRDPELVEAIVSTHGERVVASLDARAGKITAQGWTESSELDAAELAGLLAARGVSRFVFTPVERDGLMEGPDAEALAALAAATGGEIIYSGGIGSLDDLGTLAALELPNLGGVIVGRALYEKRFTVADALEALA